MGGAVKLSVIRDGHRFSYSERQLRLDHPNVSFPRDLSTVDLSPYGVVAETSRADVGNQVFPAHQRIAMHCFLYGLREFGLRVQFENYMLGLEGHARDFWMFAPYVVRSSTYVRHMAAHFGLSDHDLTAIYLAGSSIEE